LGARQRAWGHFSEYSIKDAPVASGKFITFEGGEGTGKSTQVKLLAEALARAGIDVLATREPGGAPGAEQIRTLLVNGDVGRWSPMSEALLNYAARAEHLEKMNCLRMNIGVEHGNEEYRAKTLQRKVSNEKMLDAFRSVAGRNFTTVANSIIGMPGETRELVFDTIEFNRQLPKEIEASGAFIFTPFHGTPLREVAIREGYLDADSICTLGTTQGSILDMPQFSAEEIQGMCRVFSFYAKMPKERWPDIEAAESFTEDGEKAFEKIHEDF